VFSKEGIDRFIANEAKNPNGSFQSLPLLDAMEVDGIYKEGEATNGHE
jgi:hypothetical protein